MKTGTYTYRVTDYRGGYTDQSVRVVVVGETAKSYKVKLLGFGANGTRPGHVTHVRKKAVSLFPAAPIAPPRLPYKD